MNTFVIGDNEYVIPRDYLLSDWKDVLSQDDDDSIISKSLKCTLEEVALIPPDTKHLLIAFLQQSLFPPFTHNKSVLKDFDQFSFGEFVDLEVYLNLGPVQYIEEIARLLYKDLDDSIKISDVWSGYLAYGRYRKALFFSYKNLFTNSGDSEESDKVHPASQWYDVIMTIAGGDLTKMDEITDMPTKKVLNWLAWNKDKQRELQQ